MACFWMFESFLITTLGMHVDGQAILAMNADTLKYQSEYWPKKLPHEGVIRFIKGAIFMQSVYRKFWEEKVRICISDSPSSIASSLFHAEPEEQRT